MRLSKFTHRHDANDALGFQDWLPEGVLCTLISRRELMRIWLPMAFLTTQLLRPVALPRTAPAFPTVTFIQAACQDLNRRWQTFTSTMRSARAALPNPPRADQAIRAA